MYQFNTRHGQLKHHGMVQQMQFSTVISHLSLVVFMATSKEIPSTSSWVLPHGTECCLRGYFQANSTKIRDDFDIQKPKQYCYACNNYHGAEVDGCKVKLHRFSLQQEAGKCLETRNPIRWQTQHVELWYPLALKALVSSFVPGSANTVLAVRQLFSSQYSLSSYTFRAEIYHFSAIFH